MAVQQHPSAMGLFASHLRELVAPLDQDGGWYGVFRRRDPGGLRACLEGAEIPPWDVVEALLQDHVALGSPRGAPAEEARARRLHSAAAAAHDRRAGGREALRDRLELMTHEQARAHERGERLIGLLRGMAEDSPEARQLAADLAWLRDDHARATARIAELQARLAALAPEGPALPDDWFRPPPPAGPAMSPTAPVPSAPTPGESPTGPARSVPAGPLGPDAAVTPPAHAPEPRPAPAGPRPRGSGSLGAGAGAPARGVFGRARRGRASAAGRRRPRGARYAWLDVDDDADDTGGAEATPGYGREVTGAAGGAEEHGTRPDGGPHAASALPELPVTAAGPRGARFGGGERPAPRAEPEPPDPFDADDARRAARDAVTALLGLRTAGRGGEAHALLCEAARWPPSWLPPLALELHRQGLGADWATLLWEAASLPPERLAALADALARGGREQDAHGLLRQGVARPTEETAAAVLALDTDDRNARALIEAFVRSRTAEEAARLAAHAPHRLVPPLVEAARALSPSHERNLVHALRVAGLLGG
ncbi:hypothetical protein [Streptomyces sp. SP18CS02]|uniref:hypothetical protein n=1 Tax=Streptomyces sp. SP18CS02 TaxID=3002531 RepID=UPI002E796895|nr:hypothetical protein [Streptomyces sp. SP18CS02]MEE1753878.1 hypothetical protein [Streptomyces sp. SP18CS02]